MPCELVVIGLSAGGVDLLLRLLPALPADFRAPVVVCLHSGPDTTREMAAMLDDRAAIRVCEAEDKQPLRPGCVYLAPGGYHVLVEREGILSLSVDEPVLFARPSVDVLFDSAAQAFRERVLAVVMSGANSDGAAGAARVKAAGGTVVVQDPDTALARAMPEAALAATPVDYRVAPDELPPLLERLCGTTPA